MRSSGKFELTVTIDFSASLAITMTLGLTDVVTGGREIDIEFRFKKELVGREGVCKEFTGRDLNAAPGLDILHGFGIAEGERDGVKKGNGKPKYG